MQSVQANLLTRPDTFFGVCEALGEDFGFNANWLRTAVGILFLWNPVWVAAGYAAAGAVIALSRLLYPNPRLSAALEPEPALAAPAAEEAREEALLAA